MRGELFFDSPINNHNNLYWNKENRESSIQREIIDKNMMKSTKIIVQPPPPLPGRPSEAILNQLVGRSRSNSVPNQSTSPNSSSNAPSRPPRPSPEAVRGMQAKPTENSESFMRRKSNYNSVRPLPRDRSSSENSPSTPVTAEISTLVEEYKRRETEMKEKIKLVLASVNEERLSLHKMVKHYKGRVGMEEQRSRGLEEELKMKEEMIQILQEQIKDMELNRFQKVDSKPRAEEIELKNQLNTAQNSLKTEKEKNDDLSHRILFLEARLEKDNLNNKRMEEQFSAKFATMDREIAEKVRVELEREMREHKARESQSKFNSQSSNQSSSSSSSSQNQNAVINQLASKLSLSSNNDSNNSEREPQYTRSSSSLTEQKVSPNPSKENGLHPPKEGARSSSSFDSKSRSSVKPTLPPKNGTLSIPSTGSKSTSVSPKENHVVESSSKITESKSVEQSGVKKPKPSILALYDYASSAADDLDFQEGDLLILHKRYSDGWWLAELDGKMGRVPSNFMQDLSTVKPVRMIARGSFDPECQGDLKFKKGQIIFILNQEDDWWIGQLEDGSIGYLPRNYVKMEE
eukprot:TRINITY_DN4254_c0_g1_i1.p1 TRINITY_DN4254_c0_g1~~TRINITY_DN4254_c0_g1_i1.p1  ORF type:complete len:575 (-),score=251.53 TRINITY_DN4254_c0_g1_i1:254-1978(-)